MPHRQLTIEINDAVAMRFEDDAVITGAYLMMAVDVASGDLIAEMWLAHGFADTIQQHPVTRNTLVFADLALGLTNSSRSDQVYIPLNIPVHAGEYIHLASLEISGTVGTMAAYAIVYWEVL